MRLCPSGKRMQAELTRLAETLPSDVDVRNDGVRDEHKRAKTPLKIFLDALGMN